MLHPSDMVEGGHRGKKSAIYLCLMKSGEGSEREPCRGQDYCNRSWIRGKFCAVLGIPVPVLQWDVLMVFHGLLNLLSVLIGCGSEFLGKWRDRYKMCGVWLCCPALHKYICCRLRASLAGEVCLCIVKYSHRRCVLVKQNYLLFKKGICSSFLQ